MSDSKALRRRLQRLGRNSKPKQKPDAPLPSSQDLPPGDDLQTEFGNAYRLEEVYALDHQHGQTRLDDLLDFSPHLAAEVARDPGLSAVDLDGLLFLDTETTGLAGGAGTLVFLIGIGAFVQGQFRLRQYFLRQPGEEQALLEALSQDLKAAGGFVTFNGRAFDLPLVEMRYQVGLRRRWALTQSPHLDLLFPSRRLWRKHLPDCTLGTIERQVLGVERSHQDVPGALIPGMYLDYLRSGDASDMNRVLYHNAVDVLSLVGLTARLLHTHQSQDPEELAGAEALGVARWHQAARRYDQAETAYRAALGSRNEDVRLEAFRRLSRYLKRQDRRQEAVPVWEAWHQSAPQDIRPCIELAMVYEWHQVDLERALKWAQEALICLSYWPADWRRDQAWEAVQHRVERLKNKLSR
ncbi:MAG: ribonuclease H-like domain-containing protein [Anaerolineales bacterium]|jgi:hypothetical protein